jgi:cyanate lyase
MISRLPSHSNLLFQAKTDKSLTFADLASKLNRSEVYVAALFYGQAQADASDIAGLSQALEIPDTELLRLGLCNFPDRGRAGPMPPVEPLIYRLYEIVQNYGYAFKSVLNEKFGDGIMSAICFESGVEKEVKQDGSEWVVITLKGKWLVKLSPSFLSSLFFIFFVRVGWGEHIRWLTFSILGCLLPSSRRNQLERRQTWIVLFKSKRFEAVSYMNRERSTSSGRNAVACTYQYMLAGLNGQVAIGTRERRKM